MVEADDGRYIRVPGTPTTLVSSTFGRSAPRLAIPQLVDLAGTQTRRDPDNFRSVMRGPQPT